ncbi:hypothetical protein B0T14DRAFT_94006 [Immersiella caudata]|uniref:Uncharacterized protein n=1 Tax=Immersiella caudata TaxID=314043 RepID=A0AA39X2M6_9PEZI|nr:hypothetical protein B0T14DRAFT_94006 [Immersiella caudata]
MQVKGQTLDSRFCSSTLPAQAQDRHRSRHHNHQNYKHDAPHPCRPEPAISIHSQRYLIEQLRGNLPSFLNAPTDGFLRAKLTRHQPHHHSP